MKAQLITFYIFLLGFIFVYIFPPVVMSRFFFFWIVLIVALCLLVFYLFPDKDELLKNRFLKHSNLLILGFVIVYFQYPVDYILGFTDNNNTFVWINEAAASKSIILSSIGMLSFLIGYLLFKKQAKFPKSKNIRSQEYNVIFLKLFSILTLVFYFYSVNPLYILGGYSTGVEMGSLAKYAALLFNSLVIALIIQISRNLSDYLDNDKSKITFLKYLSKLGLLVISIIIIYLLSVIISGDRGPVITISLSIIAGYLYVSKKRVSVFIIIAIILTASFMISILGVARSFGPDLSFKERLNAAITSQNVNERKSISSSTQELAGSINTLHSVVNYIPEYHNYTFLKFQFHDMISSIPLASGLYFSSWDEKDINKYGSTANFITWIMQGDQATYGNGSSLLADFYVSAGLIGIILGMLFTGWLIRKSEYAMYTNDQIPLFWHVISIVYFSNTIYLSRSTLLESMKMVVMILLLIYLNNLLSLKKTNSNRKYYSY